MQMQNVLLRPRRRGRWETRWNISKIYIKLPNSCKSTFYKISESLRGNLINAYLQESVLIRHSDMFYVMTSGFWKYSDCKQAYD